MKKRIISVFLAFTMLFLISSHKTISVHAAESSSEGEAVYVLEDGTEIFYNSSAIDGGVDLADADAFETSKSPQYKKGSSFTAAGTRYAANKTIPIVFQTQQESYYCGPAAVRMVLSGIGIIRTQGYIAFKIGTTTSGTDFGSALVNGMNNLANSRDSAYVFYLVWHSYTAADTQTMKTNMVSSIDYGNPILANSDESDGEHIPGHGEADILYHYGCVNGYTNYGATFHYCDPAYGYPDMSSVYQYQDLSCDTLSLALGGRGYVY